MIYEEDRESFMDLTIPPVDYKLTYCIGTTFTLELECLIQLALNSYGSPRSISDLSFHERFEVITEFAKKSCVFVQSCRIKDLGDEKTENFEKFINLLDGIVQEVPSTSLYGVFHPKVWLIRFDSTHDKLKPIFKFMVMSRNLTSSLKWDVSVNLIGRLGKKSSINNEISTFIQMLQDKSSLRVMSKKKIIGKKNDLIKMAQNDLENIEFEIPDKKSFKEFEFSFKWGTQKKWKTFQFDSYKKVIVVSPFVCKKQLDRMEKHGNCILVTSNKDVDKIIDYKGLSKKTYIMDSGKMLLHAKIYLGLSDNGTDIYIGSANCTNAAWAGDNVEANLKLVAGQASYANFIKAFIYKEDGELRDWLVEYASFYSEVTSDDEDEDFECEKQLDVLQSILSEGEFYLQYGKETLLEFKSQHPFPENVSGVVSILGANKSISLEAIFNIQGKLEFIPSIDRSAFLSIEIKTKNKTRKFNTVALCEFNRSERNRNILSNSIKDFDSFWSYMEVILGIVSIKTKIKPKKKGSESSRSMHSREYVTQHQYLERLLLMGMADPELIQKVEMAMTSLLASQQDHGVCLQLKNFQKMWVQFKLAYEEFKLHG